MYENIGPSGSGRGFADWQAYNKNNSGRSSDNVSECFAIIVFSIYICIIAALVNSNSSILVILGTFISIVVFMASMVEYAKLHKADSKK